MSENKIVLLDRDGTVVVEPPTRDVKMSNFELFPDALEALTTLAKAGFKAVFVSNQTGIADRDLSLEEYEATNQKMLELIKPTGLEVLKIYLCPHGVNDSCECRKPKPGMLLQAIEEFDINPAEAFMIGDNVTDVEAGIAAGAKTILLRQGINKDETDRATYIADNLSDAVDFILTENRQFI
jgi:D-glycero-D-manno-heptose 1,7-bisphosphate phosphatase